MSYPKKNVEFVLEELEKKRIEHEKERVLHINEVYSLSPELKKTDAKLAKSGLEIMHAAMKGKKGIQSKIAKIKNRNLALQKKRAELLESLGYPRDYTDIKYDCEICHDTGYDGINMCQCYKNALILKGYESSGIAKLLETQSFETFSLDYYTEDELVYMKDNYNDLYFFSHNFDKDKRNFLLIGGTGLGKTHLSTSAAKVVVEKGFNVVYETAQNIFSDFYSDKFKDRYSGEETASQKYLDCDLLIIDDLGTEAISAFSVSCLYNIINTRVNRDLPLIVSTNLTREELRKNYHDRITSRLFGDFRLKRFEGRDIRRKKVFGSDS